MSWRTIIITKRCKLDYSMNYMVIRGESTSRVLLDEIALIILENNAISITGCLLSELLKKACNVEIIDDSESLIDKIINYITISLDLLDTELFIFVNFKSFINDNKFQDFIDTIVSKHINVLMLENNDINGYDHVNKTIFVNCKIKMYKKWKIKMYNYLSSVHHPGLQEVLASL